MRDVYTPPLREFRGPTPVWGRARWPGWVRMLIIATGSAFGWAVVIGAVFVIRAAMS